MKTKIIAEIGINHNGSLAKATKLVDIAKKNNADFVKFQMYKTENLVSHKSPLAEYQKISTKNINQYELLKKYELSYEKLIFLKNYCNKQNIKFLCSPFDNESANFLINNLNQKIVKIPSGEINNFPMLKLLLKKNGIKMIISTGMSNIYEISKTVNFLKNNNFNINKNLTLLHCISSYPTKILDMNLRFINTLRDKFKVRVGLSDHTDDIHLCKFAVALDCEYIEKHITLSNSMTGPDHLSSLNPKNFSKFTKEIITSNLIMGKKTKLLKKDVLDIRKVAMKSIYAKKNININDKFSYQNIILKRPLEEKGLNSEYFFKLIGKKSKKKYLKDSLIKL